MHFAAIGIRFDSQNITIFMFRGKNLNLLFYTLGGGGWISKSIDTICSETYSYSQMFTFFWKNLVL